MDYNIAAKSVAQSASRALGLLIVKFKLIGGMPYDVFTKLYNTLVQPVISYGAAIWGIKSYSCISAIQNRAMRVFLGTGKYTPSSAIIGDMGWEPAHIRQWRSVASHWYRGNTWDDGDLRKIILLWASNNKCKNWCFLFKNSCDKIGVDITMNSINGSKCDFVEGIVNKFMESFIIQWKASINKN